MILYGKYFEIKDYPDDVYKALGKIIATSQEWEERFKVLANMLEIPFKKIGNASLNKLIVLSKSLNFWKLSSIRRNSLFLKQ